MLSLLKSKAIFAALLALPLILEPVEGLWSVLADGSASSEGDSSSDESEGEQESGDEPVIALGRTSVLGIPTRSRLCARHNRCGKPTALSPVSYRPSPSGHGFTLRC